MRSPPTCLNCRLTNIDNGCVGDILDNLLTHVTFKDLNISGKFFNPRPPSSVFLKKNITFNLVRFVIPYKSKHGFMNTRKDRPIRCA